MHVSRAFVVLLLLSGCGAKTGLLIPDSGEPVR